MPNLKRSIILLGLLVALGSDSAIALASGGGGGAIAPPRPGASDAFAMTKTVKGSFVKLDAEKSTLVIKDANKNQELTLTINKKTRFRAEDPKDFGGRKELKADEIASNTAVKVIYQEIDKAVVEIKVLKKS
ncbi:MAG: hypothetical protein K1Y36_23635 [Blastocatellia bacterium]|nr:hypothetical protein [Blastocatellia bacterium]